MTSPLHSFLSMTLACRCWTCVFSCINLHCLSFTKWCCLTYATAGKACCRRPGTCRMSWTEGQREGDTISRWFSGWKTVAGTELGQETDQGQSMCHEWCNHPGGLESRGRPTEASEGLTLKIPLTVSGTSCSEDWNGESVTSLQR